MSCFSGRNFQPKSVEEWALAHIRSSFSIIWEEICDWDGSNFLAGPSDSLPWEVCMLIWKTVPLTLAIPLLVRTLHCVCIYFLRATYAS